jgi:hypothetical protein
MLKSEKCYYQWVKCMLMNLLIETKKLNKIRGILENPLIY